MNTSAPRVKSALTPVAFLVRGLAVGVVAGLLAFVVAYFVGEPHVERAIELEESSAAAEPSSDGHSHDEPGAHSHADDADAADEEVTEVPRGIQRTLGLLSGTLAIGVALGGIVALAAAAAVGRLGSLTARQATAVVVLVGFVSFALVPFLKYPATPPAVGDPATIGTHTAAYFGVVALSVVAAVAAVLLAQRLWRRHGAYAATVAAGASYLLVVAVAAVLLPSVEEAGAFPAGTLWDFRVASLLTLATLWGALGIGLTALVGRMYDAAATVAERRALAASL